MESRRVFSWLIWGNIATTLPAERSHLSTLQSRKIEGMCEGEYLPHGKNIGIYTYTYTH